MRNLMVIVLLVASSASLADECGDVSAYSVREINFRKFEVSEAVSAVLQDTPFRAEFSKEPDKLITAKAVKGRLDAVLNSLAGKAGMTFKKNGCVLAFSQKSTLLDKGESTEWVMRAGQSVDDEMMAWAKRVGLPFEWKVQASWRVPATVKFSGTHEEAVTAAIRAMYADGKPIKLKIYDNYMEVVDYVPQ